MEWTRGPTIGRGSTATVSLATSLSSGELFAVKSTELPNSTSLQREQEFLSKISSPFVIKYIGFDVTKENNVPMYNLCLEYIFGGTLYEEISRKGGKLEESKIILYTRDILQGLDYLHREIGLAHCDIKSQNVLVTKQRAKIADLGSARLVQEGSATWAFSGTPFFMSPEVARGEDQGFQADIWALGCTIIEMATGKHPWEGFYNDPVSVLYRIGFSSDVPVFPSWLSEKGKDFLSNCLKRDAKERWTAKELLEHPFLNGVDLEAIEGEEELVMSSPICVLDLGFWDSMEALESPQDMGCLDSAIERIKSLVGNAFSSVLELPKWGLEKHWTTVRISSDVEDKSLILENEASVSTTTLFPDSSSIYHHAQGNNEDLSLEISVDNVRIVNNVNSSANRNVISTSGLDDVVSELYNFEADNVDSYLSTFVVSFNFSGLLIYVPKVG